MKTKSKYISSEKKPLGEMTDIGIRTDWQLTTNGQRQSREL